MKIKLSRFYWNYFYGMLVLGIVVEIILGYLCVGSSGADLLICIGLMLLCVFVFSFTMLMRWKYLMKIIVYKKQISSFLFGKLKCKVNTEQEVYYCIFKCNETNTNTKTYIAISNEKFIYKEKEKTFWSAKTFIDSCDINKIIVLPYEKATEQLFQIENWIWTGQGDGSMS